MIKEESPKRVGLETEKRLNIARQFGLCVAAYLKYSLFVWRRRFDWGGEPITIVCFGKYILHVEFHSILDVLNLHILYGEIENIST
jgi:hypothetical protein